MDIPELGPLTPQKNNAFTRALGRLLLSILRWQVKGQVHNVPKFLMVLAPHTSIWDFFIAHASMMAVGFRSSWLVAARHARWPLGKLMRRLGGIPIHRDIIKRIMNA